MAVRRRVLTAASVLGCGLSMLSAFLPWRSGVKGTLSGWGSEAHPDLRGMLLITCIATALTLVVSSVGAIGLRRRVLAELAAAVLVIGLVEASTIIANPSVDSGVGASNSLAAWVTVAALVVAIAASIGGALTSDA